MHRPYPVNQRIALHLGLYSAYGLCQFHLRPHEVNIAEEDIRLQQLRHVWTYLSRQFGQNPYHLPALLRFQFAHPVVGFHHLSRLHKHGLSRSRLVVHNTLNPSLQRGRHGYHQSSVSQCGRNILIHESLTLGRA